MGNLPYGNPLLLPFISSCTSKPVPVGKAPACEETGLYILTQAGRHCCECLSGLCKTFQRLWHEGVICPTLEQLVKYSVYTQLQNGQIIPFGAVLACKNGAGKKTGAPPLCPGPEPNSNMLCNCWRNIYSETPFISNAPCLVENELLRKSLPSGIEFPCQNYTLTLVSYFQLVSDVG